jgi:hypothetical protein
MYKLLDGIGLDSWANDFDSSQYQRHSLLIAYASKPHGQNNYSKIQSFRPGKIACPKGGSSQGVIVLAIWQPPSWHWRPWHFLDCSVLIKKKGNAVPTWNFVHVCPEN